MKRIILAAILALCATSVQAQSTVNCVSASCTFVTDPIVGTPSGPPIGCRLYSGATMLAEAPVTAPYACTFTRNFAAGTYSLTARYFNAAGESANSNVLTFTSALPVPVPPAPTNLRFQ